MKTPAISSGAKIVEEEVDGLHHRFYVELDSEDVRAAVDEQLRRAAPRLDVPGFRRGRAPLTVLRNHHGTRVRNTIVDRVAIDLTSDLIAERGLLPRARPSIHIDAKAPESFLLSLEVAPEIEPGNLADIHVQRLEVTGADDELQAMAREHERRQLFDTLMEHYRFPVPGEMVDNERARISAGYREAVGEAPDLSTERELVAIAERRVRLALLFAELARRHAISVARSEVEQLAEGLADRDPAHQEEIIDYYLDHPTAMAELQSPLLEQRVTDFILEHCTVTFETVSAAQLRQRVSAAAMP